MNRISRREFLQASAATFAALVVSKGVVGCRWEDDPSRPQASFRHGVASGDPLADQVILWTRVTPEDGQDTLDVDWEVATDPHFQYPVHRGRTQTDEARDFTVKIDVQGLTPGQVYYYRFRAGGSRSGVGRTRTLPTGAVDQVRVAVFSCANIAQGYFHAYGEAAKGEPVDAVIHLGDYIYEYDVHAYADDTRQPPFRKAATDRHTGDGGLAVEDLEPEAISLEGYRQRYALYRLEQDLQRLHAAAPMIAVWDDHEIANDAWREGARNHDDSEGDYAERRRAAVQAYFEWMPIRPINPGGPGTVYRRFDFGDLLSLYMLDTRLVGRDRPYRHDDFRSEEGKLNVERLTQALHHPQRTLLGGEQFRWFTTELLRSTTHWQVLGQQTLMARMLLPEEVLEALSKRSSDRLPEVLENARRDGHAHPRIPYLMHGWDGYAYEREAILELTQRLDKRLVVLTGDSHNAWGSHLTTQQGDLVGAEFAVASVASPGLEKRAGIAAQQGGRVASALRGLVEDLAYANVHERGYLVVAFTPQEVRADWHFIDSVRTLQYRSRHGHSLTYRHGKKMTEVPS